MTGEGRGHVGSVQNFGMQTLAIYRATNRSKDRVQVNGPMSNVGVPLHPENLLRQAIIVNGSYQHAAPNG